MSSTQRTHPRGTVRPSPLSPLRRLLGPFAAIVLASAAVIAITVALASSPAGSTLTNAMAPAVAKPAGASRPAAPAASASGQVDAAPVADASAPASSAPAAPAARTPGGRNVPSFQRGWLDLLKYGGIMAGATLAAVLVLRVRRPQPRLRPTPAARNPAQLAPARHIVTPAVGGPRAAGTRTVRPT